MAPSTGMAGKYSFIEAAWEHTCLAASGTWIETEYRVLASREGRWN